MQCDLAFYVICPLQVDETATLADLVKEILPDKAPVTSAIFPSSLATYFSWRRGTAEHDQIAHKYLHGFVVLIQCRGPHLDGSLVGTRLRGSYLEHFAFDPKLIAWPNWSWPAEFIKAGADDAASGFEVAFDQ